MNEAKSLGMKSLTRKESETVLYELTIFCVYGSFTDLRSIIAFIIEERMPYPVEMHSYLVRPSRLKPAFDDSNISESFKNAIMGHCMFPMISLRKHLESHSVVRITSDISDDGSFIILEISPNNGNISTFDRMHKKLLGKIELSLIILGNDQQA